MVRSFTHRRSQLVSVAGAVMNWPTNNGDDKDKSPWQKQKFSRNLLKRSVIRNSFLFKTLPFCLASPNEACITLYIIEYFRHSDSPVE